MHIGHVFTVIVVSCICSTCFQSSDALQEHFSFCGRTVQRNWAMLHFMAPLLLAGLRLDYTGHFSVVMMWSTSSLRHGPVFQRASSMKLLTSSAAWLHAFVPAKCFHLNTYRDTCSCSKLCPEPPEQVGNYVCIYTNKWEIMYAFTLCLKKTRH